MMAVTTLRLYILLKFSYRYIKDLLVFDINFRVEIPPNK